MRVRCKLRRAIKAGRVPAFRLSRQQINKVPALAEGTFTCTWRSEVRSRVSLKTGHVLNCPDVRGPFGAPIKKNE